MTSRTRYFVIVSLLILTIGLGTGLIAYYFGLPLGAAQSATDDLKLVPHDVSLVAYADVRAVMVSQVRQRILEMLPAQGNGAQDFESQTGIKIDSDVDRVVGCLAPSAKGSGQPLAGMVLVRGRFDEAKIDALMRAHGAREEDYNGKRLLVGDVQVGQTGSASLSLAFVESGLVAAGTTELVRAAIDLTHGGANVTGNEEVMNFVRTFDGTDAWTVGRFDMLTASAPLPAGATSQLPLITWISASGRVDSGIAGTFRADTRDAESASSLRDLLRGIIAFARLQTGSHPELQPMLDSLQLGGTSTSVTLAFDVSPQMFDQLATAFKGLQRRPLTPR